MNVLPVGVEGASARIGAQTIGLPGAPQASQKNVELGIRPECIRLGREGMPVSISKVEDIGRRKLVRAELEGREIAVIAGEDEEIPAEPRVLFDPAGINLYADSWRVELGGSGTGG